MQVSQGSIEHSQVRCDGAAAPARAVRSASTLSARPGASTAWVGSAFDLAQGLEVTILETRMSIEDLDELFR